MKEMMMSREKATYLFDHVLDGFKSSYEGIESLRSMGLVDQAECMSMHKKNSERLIERIKEFKLVQKITCVFFAAMFTWMQVSNQDMEMRRRGRLRKRNETELTV